MGSSSTMLFPRDVIYGKDSFQETGKNARKFGTKALIISDPIMQKLGYLESCERLLEEEGISYEKYIDIVSEPTDTYVKEALELADELGAELIIALGGGSCIDTAKAVAVMARNRGEISDYMNNKTVADQDPLPLIAIPTTAGTGSEATDVTVITNTKNDVKMMIKQPAFMPQTAIVDPVLTMSSPKGTTAATGVDALTHAVEAYISKKAHPFSDQLALSAAKLIMENLEKAYKNGDDEEAREKMALGAMQAGMAFSNASVCLVHGMSRPVGALFHVPHGISNAMLLPTVLEYSYESCKSRLADMARFIFPEKNELSTDEASAFFVNQVIELCRNLDIPNMKEWGVEESAFYSSLEKMAEDALDSGSPNNNPIVPKIEEMIKLYRRAYVYEYPQVKEIHD
ncbi:iron-containing alcohol dehydrogenase [Alteribacillus iranensis]|uniref:1,3-propanediol dehydrogenase n=1 Tax=Alteribacillus iranensis TaxID=930128 RepID=A0A1I2C264_9BACI|nr:iron-containing alcohol dehydrogenase [Alteribacillus iranensis]SFE62374.1 1,3-propanediol dehydrogenase [Alteribacillus iranensis]